MLVPVDFLRRRNLSCEQSEKVNYIFHFFPCVCFQDPFSGIKNEYKEHLSEEVKKQLRPFFVQASVDTFILELHELLTLKCKNVQSPDSFNPTWR